ncbi:zinc finger MYND domain-containing protein 15-like [Seminavis robusta]|uniref:Zinc finger MYND domain-containing protein 15-like n=1 Tax=Seminavis robusta TaxID=568900 RepID=A0A9N8DLK4_9STRA|nr:zinc finger MYND domain-containing protein 15-like [Seminavis robusta]|eukprot:Sro123_g059430.1 zinc finger MYND domain-containing protein 15-like (462) ;mRNA; r:15464-16849
MSMFAIVEENVRSKPDVPLPRIRDPLDEGGPPYSNAVCLGCNRKQSSAPQQPFSTCSQCHAVKYCSRDCQLKDWKGKGDGPTKPRKHKDICPQLKAAIAEFQNHPIAGVKLRSDVFSDWANQHCSNGSFHLHEFLARKQLLGGAEKGFWAIPDVLTPYHTVGQDQHGFQNGHMLLQTAWPSMQEGWTTALNEPEQIDVTQSPPNPLVLSTRIQGWKDYITWRNLPPSSVAPLLMTNVLTLYHMLQNELHLYDPHPKEGQQAEPLQIYVLAVEAELNQIPLLQELLHLMPGIDLELIYLSPAAKAICEQAAGSDNLLTTSNYVLDVTAQHGGRLRVRVDPTYALYEDVPNTIQPHAVVGLNAGLASYKTWAPAMHKILRMGTPFCFSDQTKLIQQFAVDQWIPSVVTTINNAFPNYRQLVVPDDMTIRLNPFHGIVGRDVAYILAPNISNGYLLTSTMAAQE